MKVIDLINQLGAELGEDFTYSVVWTRVSLLNYTKQTLAQFCERTMLVDKVEIRLLNTTTGEIELPDNFGQLYYALYNNHHIDLAQLGDMDFISADWSINTTATTPLAATQVGSVIKFVPVPSGAASASDYAPSYVTGYRHDPVDDSRNIYSSYGALYTAVATAGTGATIVLAGPTIKWDVYLDTSDVINTSISTSTSPTGVIILDGSDGFPYTLTVNDAGVISTSTITGKLVNFKIDGVYQDFISDGSLANADYGIVVGVRGAGTSTTPSLMAFKSEPYGSTVSYHSSDNAAMIWYKGRLEELSGLYGELTVNDAFIPIIKHGVLARAYNQEGPGRDYDKAKMLDAIFLAECDAVKSIYERK